MQAPPTPEELDGILGAIFLTAEGKADPYPGFAAVREATPVYRSALGPFVTLRYEECQQILRDNRFGHGDDTGAEFAAAGLTEEEAAARFPRRAGRVRTMLELDPPDHTRLRGLVAKAFTPRTVSALRPRIEELTAELLDPLEGEVDVIAALALRLPITVIGEMLGVPASDHAALEPTIKVLVRSLATFDLDLEELTAIYEANNVLDDYFAALAAEKRAAPGPDLFSQLLHVEKEGDVLSEAELLSTVLLLFVAGYETTTNLIGNGLRALLVHPDQLARLRSEPGLVRSAVEEMLRYDSPVQLTSRRALADGLDVAGTVVAPGEEILTVLGGANRDPSVFDRPDEFDVARYAGTPPATPPLSFSAGIHYCLGAALARAEGQVVFSQLLGRYRTIEPAWAPDAPPTYRDSVVLRGLESLPVRLEF